MEKMHVITKKDEQLQPEIEEKKAKGKQMFSLISSYNAKVFSSNPPKSSIVINPDPTPSR